MSTPHQPYDDPMARSQPDRRRDTIAFGRSRGPSKGGFDVCLAALPGAESATPDETQQLAMYAPRPA